MSDGPHRSLKMRPGWKKAAEFADRAASTPEEVGVAAEAAIAQDWYRDVPDAVADCVREVLGGSQDSLFRDQKVMQLEALRQLAAGHGLGQLLIDCAIQRVEKGEAGADAAEHAATDALCVWGSRHGWQIEEHYCRKANEHRAADVRGRIELGIGGTALQGLARQLLRLDPTPAPRTLPKQSGLDDGAPL